MPTEEKTKKQEKILVQYHGEVMELDTLDQRVDAYLEKHGEAMAQQEAENEKLFGFATIELQAQEQVIGSGTSHNLQATERKNRSKQTRNKLKSNLKKADKKREADRKWMREHGTNLDPASAADAGDETELLEAIQERSLQLEAASLEVDAAQMKGLSKSEAVKQIAKGHSYILERSDVTGQERRTRAAKYKNMNYSTMVGYKSEELEKDYQALLHNVRLDQLNREKEGNHFGLSETSRQVAKAARALPVLNQENAALDEQIRKTTKETTASYNTPAEKQEALQQLQELKKQKANVEKFLSGFRDAVSSLSTLEANEREMRAVRRAYAIIREDHEISKSVYDQKLEQMLNDQYKDLDQKSRSLKGKVLRPQSKTDGGQEASRWAGELIQKLAKLEDSRLTAGQAELEAEQAKLTATGYGSLMKDWKVDDNAGRENYEADVRKMFRTICRGETPQA